MKEEGAVPDFLRMDQPVSSDPANAKKTGNWHGWPTKDVNPVILTDDEGRTVRIRTPVMDLEGLITDQPALYRPAFCSAASRGDRRVGAQYCR